MAKLPESVIAEIRERTDLVELIGSYVNLKRSGRNHLGLCPFHQEKTPSFNVNSDRQIYHCFGCGVTGDAFKFLMEHDRLSFPEALRTLAGRAGIDLSRYESSGPGGQDELDELYQAHALALRLFRQVLGTDEGRAARQELARRGISDATVQEYRLGATPDAWDRLITAARREGVRPSALERSGLTIRRESGTGSYDRFRGRLMFPIESITSKVVGFGGRILGEGEPKYLNSPETPLFRKRKLLYGLPQAKDALRESRAALLVEGYTDVLALAQAGHRNALASLGTAFTEEHAKALARNVDRVTVLFDGDEAGRKAASASIGPLLGAGLDVQVALLPAGQDPDSLLRASGPEELARALEAARPALDVLLGDEVYEGGASRERAVRRALEALASVADPLRRRVYVEDLALRTSLPGDVLDRQLAELAERGSALRARESARETPQPKPEPPPQPAAKVFAEADETKRPPALERTFIALLLQDSSDARALLERFRAEDFEHPVTARIVSRAAEISAAGKLDVNGLLAAFEQDERAYAFLGELAVSNEFAVGVTRQVDDCRTGMERRQLEREQQQLMQEIRKANARGDAGRVRELVRRRGELARGIEALRAPRKIGEER
ncbi:MAG: DNA primase [Candidatus Eiseniibacteriota bacterium]